jgi:DNA-binding beta-propeller fold protein YncE
MRIGVRVSVGAFLAAVTGASWLQSSMVAGAVPPSKDITITPIGVHRTGYFDSGGSEIAAYDPGTRRVFSVNLEDAQVDVLDISDPTNPVALAPIEVSPWGTQANSVDAHNGVVAIAIEAAPKTSPGNVLFTTASGDFLSIVPVGALPDMLTFTPDGQFVLVANEGEPNSYGQGAPAPSIDPEGSVSIIDMRNGASNLTQSDVTTAGFGAFSKASLDPAIRIYGPNASVAQDLEPEYIAVSHDSKTAWVTLQENNAIGILDIKQKKFTKIVALGFKNHALAGKGLDSSDRDDHMNNIVPRPVWGMYQPDGIAAFHLKGKTYLVTANEGDVREWTGVFPSGTGNARNTEAARVSALTVDANSPAFPLTGNSALGRLNVTKYNGNTDADAAYEQLFSFGARSFSIWNAHAALVYDSGDALEQITKAAYPRTGSSAGEVGYFNANSTNNVNDPNDDEDDWTHDSRSDDKGPEPEGVAVAKLFGREFAFITLERIGGVMIFEVTNPMAPRFVDYINPRVFGSPAEIEDSDPPQVNPAVEDLGPEGLIVIKEEDSPTGRPLLVVANEISGTARIYEISQQK